jgi:GDP-L-fucose synthase
MAETMKNVVGFKGKLNYDRTRPDGTPRKLIDVSRLSNLGWKSSTSLREGFKNTYEWYLTEKHS